MIFKYKLVKMHCCFWLLLLIQPVFLVAQNGPYNFSKLTTNNGLSHNQINSILKDTDGFLWFGTTSGLDRYDGYSFKIYRKNPDDSGSLSDNSIISLFDLPDNKMWVMTRGIPCIYNSRAEKFDSNCNSYLNSIKLPSGSIS